MDEISPIKKVTISTKRHFVEPWMTRGLEKSSKRKHDLYKASITLNATNTDRERYITYRNNFNKTKRAMHIHCYTSRATEFKNNTKKLWQLLNSIINKTKHRGSIIPYITINGLKTYHPSKIANAFGKFYSNLGKDLVAKIPKGNFNVGHYLNKIPRNMKSMVMTPTTVSEIESRIQHLPNKMSQGHDGISNVLLKKLCKCISFLLCLIFNESIAEGKFPTKMKMAEVIPLHKGRELDQVINYRPISLLITISKVLEKIVYIRVYKFLQDNKILYNSQYGFCSKHSCEQAILELIGNVIQAKYKGMHTAALFLDLSKAFDTLNHEVLLKN